MSTTPHRMTRRQAKQARRDAAATDLDTLLGWTALDDTPPPRRNKLLAILQALIASAFLGGLVSLLAIPWVAAGAITLREANQAWEQMPQKLPSQSLPQRSVMYAADGTKIAEFYSENRVLVALDDVAPIMRDAIIDIEDSRFYDHHGIDPKGTVRAFANNALTASTQGGSTLTQQYVKQVLLDAATTAEERDAATSRTSYMRKLREARYATALEDRYTKDQILEGYLNIAYFGDGAYGIGAAARHYFNTTAAKLTLPQAALLAGLVQNPTLHDPTNNPDAAVERRNTVLFRMRQLGTITPAQYTAARDTKLALRLTSPANGCTKATHPFFCQYVKQQLETDPAFGPTPAARAQLIFRGGLTIRTTLNPTRQAAAQKAVDTALGRDNRVAAASVTVQPGTGHIITMATNRTFGQPKKGRFDKTEVLLPALPAYQPGSNFKPFTLAAALERGFNPATRLYAPPVYAPANANYPGAGFQNSSTSGTGNLTAAQAIARSSNTWFIKLQEQVGVLNVAKTTQRLGITSLPLDGPDAITARDASLTLGAYEVSPLEMAAAYATFAAEGTHCKPIAITTVTGPTGTRLPVPDADCHEAIPAGVANTVATLMTGTIDGPDPARTGKDMTIGRPAAGKTGTTQGNAAVWFSGFTPQYSTAVWVGDPRGGFAYPLRGFYAQGRYIDRAYGGLVAGPIWRTVMADLHRNQPVQRFPKATLGLGYTNQAPDVRGLTLDQAYRVLTRAGFTPELAPRNAREDAALTPNRVYTTTPAPGTLLGTGTRIRITLTHGSDRNVTITPTPATPTPAPNRPGDRWDTGGGIVTRP